ncbi:MAG: hypothetical protein U0X39_15245 [Bacteroidales bacterium]
MHRERVSAIELMSNVPESYAGAPVMPKRPAMDAPESEKQAFQTALAEFNQKTKEWRTTVSMDKFIELRKMYNKAGVDIHIVKFSPENWSDEEIDYAFRAAKAMGAKGVSTEIGDKSAQKLKILLPRNTVCTTSCIIMVSLVSGMEF